MLFYLKFEPIYWLFFLLLTNRLGQYQVKFGNKDYECAFFCGDAKQRH